MRMDKLTIKSQEALAAAGKAAEASGHQEVTTEHLLAALVATVIVLFAEGPDLLTIIDQH